MILAFHLLSHLDIVLVVFQLVSNTRTRGPAPSECGFRGHGAGGSATQRIGGFIDLR
jgi:hypothetical protein